VNYYILIWALDRFCFMLEPPRPRAATDTATIDSPCALYCTLQQQRATTVTTT
jgi:hypothetical protein